MCKSNVIWTLHLFYRHNTSCKNIYTKTAIHTLTWARPPVHPSPRASYGPVIILVLTFTLSQFRSSVYLVGHCSMIFRGFFGFLFVKKSFRKKCALSLFDKGRLWTVLLVEIFPIFDFSTSNSINFYTSVTQLSGKFHFKPSEVL